MGYGTTNPAPPLTGAPTLTPIPPTTAGPTSTLQQPTFDPYSSQPNTVYSPPSLLSPPATTYGTAPQAYPPPGTPQPYTSGTPAYGQQPYPPGTQQPYMGFGTQTPPVLYPQGLFGTQPPGTTPSYPNPMKLCQNIRVDYTWLYGDKGMDLDINDLYLTSTIALPNFLWSGQPWFISPGFGLHLWSGPQAFGMPALPSKAYSAFLDLGWRSDTNSAFGVELAGRIGIFSDFTGVVDQSVRPSGNALMRYNMTPTLALKAGVEFINRADKKLLPALGVIWTPTPQRRWEIYFPQPRFSCYLTTLGNRETWWYVGAEYGGGSWTPKLQFDLDKDGILDWEERSLMDINDIRVMIGMDFMPPGAVGMGKRGAFIELGYVFERKVVIVAIPSESFNPKSTFMIRGGVAF